MSEPTVSRVKDASEKCTDQIDGSSMSLGRKKGVKVSGRYLAPTDSERRGASIPLVQSTVPGPRPTVSPTIISIGPQHRGPSVSPELTRRSLARPDSMGPRDEWSSQNKASCGEASVSRQTLDELKNLLRETSVLTSKDQKDGVRPGSPYTYLHGNRQDGQHEVGLAKSFSTFKPLSDGSRRFPRPGERISSQTASDWDSSASSRTDGHTRPNLRPSTCETTSMGETYGSQTEHGSGRQQTANSSGQQVPSCSSIPGLRGATRTLYTGNIRISVSSRLHLVPGPALQATVSVPNNSKESTSGESHAPQSFISVVEQIKQQIAREDVKFVRFEATDLHGVSRSKIVPARFFHEKAVYGVPMPRAYLELTLSSKVNEVDNANVANFSSDILLIPDMSTFKILPWANHTARVICDPCSVTGVPLRTSPRLIAKQLLAQLQNMGFSLHSSLTYECCLLGLGERVGPKAVFFPATTLLSNNDLPFLHQLITGMYYMGVDVDSFASASGPGQMEISLKPKFGIDAADSAFTFRTGIKEMARKYNYLASFYTDDGMYNAGGFSHSLWDANGRRSLFHTGGGDLSEIGRKWLAGLLHHSAAISCLMAPGVGCRNQLTKGVKDQKRAVFATCGSNDNSCAFNVKFHGGRETHIENKLGSAMANPYIVLAATLAAGLDGIKHNLSFEYSLNRAPSQQKQFAIPEKLECALEALAEDKVIRGALGEPFVQYFIAMKKFEIETQELDAERNKSLEYFI
ncbi:lengsin [Clupea harengus]|uniref:Lengsin n=1 Tax=Clupea harengus TaxID=7950 RepID=A0A8M1KC56_CLUHA|nr:lengsin [Clupea harengus]